MKEFKSSYPLFWDTHNATDGNGEIDIEMNQPSVNGELYPPKALNGDEIYTWSGGDTPDPIRATNNCLQDVEPDHAVDHRYLSKGHIDVTARIQTKYTKTYTASLTTNTTRTRVGTVEKLKSALKKVANLRANIDANLARLEKEIFKTRIYNK